jgi:hypothetical protein
MKGTESATAYDAGRSLTTKRRYTDYVYTRRRTVLVIVALIFSPILSSSESPQWGSADRAMIPMPSIEPITSPESYTSEPSKTDPHDP